jgi:hypothetical protein
MNLCCDKSTLKEMNSAPRPGAPAANELACAGAAAARIASALDIIHAAETHDLPLLAF